MSKGAKVTLIVIAAVVVVFGGATVGITLWLRSQGGLDGLADKAEHAMQDGREFARDGHVQDECLAGALAAHADCRGIRCAVSAQLWARGCLDVAPITEGLCDDVPGPLRILESAKWQLDKCEGLGHGSDRTCQQTVSVVQQYCDERR